MMCRQYYPLPDCIHQQGLFSADWWYSNIEWEVSDTLHGLGKFHHYCLAKEAHVITDHKPLVAKVNKDVTTLSQWLQCIMLHIHQYSMFILYKPDPELYIGDWVFHNKQAENRDQEITGVNINIHTISTTVDIPICMFIEDIRTATNEDADQQILKTHMIRGWPHNKDELDPGV